MGVFDTKYLSHEKLRGFNNYKYSCIDNSPIAVYISHPFWNWFVNFYPTWLAPNVLTLAGASLVMGCFFLVSGFDYMLDSNSAHSPVSGAIPNWIWIVCGVCTFSAHLLDGTDGKQARRTGASGPTGELFDHGLDSWSTVPFTITIFSIFGQGEYSVSLVRLLLILISVQLVFIVTHWEKYNTGVLFLSWGYDASQYGLSLFYLLTWIVGYQWFQFKIIGDWTFANCFEMVFYLPCLLSFAMSVYNMYVAYEVEKTGKHASNFERIYPMIGPSLLFIASLAWAQYSPQNVISQDPRVFFWTMGTVFSNIATQLIISQMSCTRAEFVNIPLFAYLAAVAVSLTQPVFVNELAVLYVLGLFVTVAHVHYGVCVVRQLCDNFKIQAFSLEYLEKRKRRDNADQPSDEFDSLLSV